MIKYVNVDDLQKLAINAEKFTVIVEHAKTCKIPGELYIHYSPSSERYVAVVFDVVGCVRGLVNVDRQFVPVDDFAEADKVVPVSPLFAFSVILSWPFLDNSRFYI